MRWLTNKRFLLHIAVLVQTSCIDFLLALLLQSTLLAHLKLQSIIAPKMDRGSHQIRADVRLKVQVREEGVQIKISALFPLSGSVAATVTINRRTHYTVKEFRTKITGQMIAAGTLRILEGVQIVNDDLVRLRGNTVLWPGHTPRRQLAVPVRPVQQVISRYRN